MFFSIVGDFSDILGSLTLVPVLELFYQALSNKGGAVFLEALIIATGLGCLVASHTWQSRLCWSFARDRGLPGHRWLAPGASDIGRSAVCALRQLRHRRYCRLSIPRFV